MSPESPLYPLLRAVENDPYDSGDSRWTVTQLLKPTQAVILEERHREEIAAAEKRLAEEDPAGAGADNLWRMFGQIVHGLLERADDRPLGYVTHGDDAGEAIAEALGKPGSVVEIRRSIIPIYPPPFSVLKERRFFAEVLGVKISGQLDSLVLTPWGHLIDYKFTNVHAVSGKSGKRRLHEWEAQLNMLAWLAGEHGYQVKKLTVVAMFRDWRPGEARRKKGYPPKVMEIPLRLWSHGETQQFIEGRVQQLLRAERITGDEHLPPCTPHDTWEEPDQWACKDPRKKRARKLHPTEAAAHADRRGGEGVEFRPGDRPRCTGGASPRPYCAAAPYCHQLRKWRAR